MLPVNKDSPDRTLAGRLVIQKGQCLDNWTDQHTAA